MPLMTKGEQTALAILEAAAQCIARIGIEKTSITEIAKKADVSRGLVALYFPKKSKVFKEVVLYIAMQAYKKIESVDVSNSARDKTLHVMRANFEFFLSRPHYFKCFMLFYYYASIDPDFRKLNTEFNDRAINRFIDLFKLLRPKKSATDIKRFAEDLHDQLIGSIEKFFTVNHKLSTAAYERRAITALEERLDSFLAR